MNKYPLPLSRDCMIDEQSPFEHIPDGHRSGYVCLLGKSNVGKSTLFYTLLNEKLAILTPKAQTTREQILGIITIPERAQIILRDTPGDHSPSPMRLMNPCPKW